MRLRSLLFHSLLYHWRANVAVLLGVIVGTAVLTGALLIGDSLQGSLRELALDRLGRIDCALVSDRFFQANLATRLTRADPTVSEAVPAVIVRGTVLRRDGDRIAARAGRVQVVGVDTSFWHLFGTTREDLSNRVILNAPLADQLGARLGDLIEVRLEKPQAVPADSFVGRPNEDTAITLEASPVAEMMPESGAGRFSLQAQQQRPLVIYVALRRLQIRLAAGGQIPRNAANALLVAGTDLPRLQSALQSALSLEDLGLTLRPDHTGKNYLSLESRRLLIEPVVAETVLQLKDQAGWQVMPTLTYLANVMMNDRHVLHGMTANLGSLAARPSLIATASLAHAAGQYTPYSAICGIDPSAPEFWGTLFDMDGKRINQPLQDDEILINEWAAKDLLPVSPGDRPIIIVQYFLESDGRLLKEETAQFKLAGVVAMKGLAADRTLTPEFPGIRGTSVADWDPPFPREQWHPEWVRPRDEEYWRRYRATPKAFVSPRTAQKLWKSRHGEWTSIRIATAQQRMENGVDLQNLEETLRTRFRQALSPEKIGLQFQPVKEQGLAAAGSSTSESFGWLFLGFSIFLIGSATMLVGLLFRLGVERRAKEIGLLYAIGYRQATVRRLLLSEGAVIAAAGGVLGLLAAVAYAWLLLTGLRSWWAETLHTSFLGLHIAARQAAFGPIPYPSLTLGFLLSFGVALLAIGWAVRGLGRLSPQGLLAGQTADSSERLAQRPSRRTSYVAVLALVIAAGLAATSFLIPKNLAAPFFFGSGAMLLIGALSLSALWLRRDPKHVVTSRDWLPLLRLGARNTSRHTGRSLLTAGLLASASFLIVAVESFRKSGDTDAANRLSGTGGFPLFAETDVPDFGFLVADVGFAKTYGFRVRPGDDVSCLNLYQPQKPRIIGVPEKLIERGGFSFAALWNATDTERNNPWLLLNKQLSGEIPVLLDAHTATWILQLAPGDTYDILDDHGQPVSLRVVGLLQESIFQSELLISEVNFRKLFPSRSGYSFFLIDAPPERTGEVKHALETEFGERFGLTVSRTADRLASFQAVENTYLSTFQVLGGLGLLLGTLGLAVVLLRNVWERQGELALLRALGYRRSAVAWLVLAENGFLLLLGTVVGLVSALLAVAPHLAERSGQMPWLNLLALLFLVVATGLVAGSIAVASTLRTPLLPALRRE